MTWIVGIDTGGTFTDLAAVHRKSGEIYTSKVPSDPENPSRAMVRALEQFSEEKGVSFEEIAFLGHGTTVATNAVLEDKGVRAGLLITGGMRAIYDTRGGSRPRGADLIDPFYTKPPTLVPQYLTCEIKERITFDGSVIEPLNEDSVRQAVLELKEKGVRSIAVCYLFSFINPQHEQRTAEIINEIFPECRVSLSSKVLPVIREYPRLSTTVLDAYIGPVVEHYFNDLSLRVRELGLRTNQFYIMQSNGGLMRINVAVNYPNETLLSGPAAGVVFGTYLGRLTKQSNVVTFDMGGTSADISIISGNTYAETREGKINGQDIGTPMIQINAIGAGGGTIAYIGKDDLMKVGPKSAGAFPGPACYCRGGTEPTVTDANMMMGYLDENNFVGGRMKADKKLAEQVLTKTGQALGMDALQTAVGIVKIVNAHMAVGLRKTLVERGADPRLFVLAAFGGSGPLHATKLAQEIGIPKVILPLYPGVTCAMGLLDTDVKHIYLKSFMKSIGKADLRLLFEQYGILEKQAMEDAKIEGFSSEQIRLVRQMDVRYPHQGYELTIDCPETCERTDGKAFTDAIRKCFHDEHERIYGLSAPNEEPELVNIRIQMIGEIPKLELQPLPLKGMATGALKGYRNAFFESEDGFVNTPVYDRRLLGSGSRFEGPAIVEQVDSTTVVQPGMSVEVDDYGTMIVHCGTQRIENRNLQKAGEV